MSLHEKMRVRSVSLSGGHRLGSPIKAVKQAADREEPRGVRSLSGEDMQKYVQTRKVQF